MSFESTLSHISNLLQRREIDAAKRAIAEGIQTFGDRPGLGLMAARVTLLEGEAAQALAQVNALLDQKPPNTAACMLFKAAALAELGRLPKAVEVARKLVARPDAMPLAHVRLAAYLRRSGALPEAEAALRSLLDTRPQHLKARKDLAQLLFAQDRPTEALTLVKTLKPTEFTADLACHTIRALNAARQNPLALEIAQRVNERFPGHRPLLKLLVEALRHAGQETAALDLLSKRTEAVKNDPDLASLYADLLADAGQTETAHAALLTALEKRPKSFELQQKAAMQQAKVDPEAGLAALTKLVADFPSKPLAHLRLAEHAQQMGRPEMALQMTTAALAMHPERLALWSEHVKAQILCGQLDEVRTSVDTASRVQAEPNLFIRLLKTLTALGQGSLALRLIEARPAEHQKSAIFIWQRCLALRAEGDLVAATGALEALVACAERHPPSTKDTLDLCRQLKRQDLAFGLLEAELASDTPSHAALHMALQHMLRDSTDAQGNLDDAALSAPIWKHLPRRLIVKALLDNHRYREAEEILRSEASAFVAPRRARQLATCLMGTARPRLALRYLRRCHRTWPQERDLFSALVSTHIRLGQGEAAKRLIEGAKGTAIATPEMLAGMQRHLTVQEGKLSTLTQTGERTPVEAHNQIWRHTLATEALDEVGKGEAAKLMSLSKGATPHWRPTLVGQLTNEAQVANINGWAPSKVVEAEVKEAVRKHPQNTNFATQLLHCLTSAPVVKTQTPRVELKEIPKHIYQFWDAETPPEGVLGFMESWKSLPGYEYTLLNSRSAADLLRAQFGPRWVRAFRLSRNPAEAADFLRLCVLMRFGGIWADADDVLHGDLETLIAPGTGVCLYLENVGSAVGNNFIATAQGHPVLRRAATMARNALLRNDNDSTWTKTGPGLLSRALAQYIAAHDGTGMPADIRIMRQIDYQADVQPHNHLPYKSTKQYWANSDKSLDHGARLAELVAKANAQLREG